MNAMTEQLAMVLADQDQRQSLIAPLLALGGASEAECIGLVVRAAQVPADLAIVELGTFTGQGACCLATGAAVGLNATVWCIDMWGLRPSGQEAKYDDPGNQEATRAALDSLGLLQAAVLVRCETREAAKLWRLPIGLLVLDAGHEMVDVLSDYQNWARFVAPGGWLLMHDARNAGWPAVDEVIAEEIMPSGLWEPDEFVEPFSQWFRKQQ
jgi:hypothetical protein